MIIHAAIIVALAAAGFSEGHDDDWPHLRGPGLDGRSTSSVFEPRDFALEVGWKKSIGPGYSGVAVADGNVVTMYGDGDVDVVVALDGANGDERWRHELGPAYRGHDGSEDGPVSSPLIHDGRVYALGPRGRLVALDLETGSEVWSHDLVDRFDSKPPDYGFTTTPIAEGEILIVQIGGADGHGLGGFDLATGELRWATGDETVDYQSPIVMTLAGRRQLLAFRGQSLSGHDPASGELLWEHETGSASGFPIPVDESQVAVVVRSGLLVFEVRETPVGYELKTIMRSRELGRTWASPVRSGGHYYGFKGEFLTCVDAETGKRAWKSRPPGGQGLILVNDHLVVFGARGRVVVVAATPEEYREEASLDLFDGSGFTWPSFADGRIFVRNPREIAALDVVKSEGASKAMADGEVPDSVFARFVREVEAADDKTARVDRYFAEHTEWPIVEGDLVHFVYRGDARDVAIEGTMMDKSRPERLHHVDGTDLHHRTYRLAPGSRVEYHYQVDLEDWITDPGNTHTVPGDRGDLSEVALPGYVRADHFREPTTEHRGRLETHTFHSDSMDHDRNLTIYLPHAYDAEPERRFPMLLVLDGKNWKDKGLLVNTLDNLIGQSVAPVVVVFVEARRQWWLEAGGSETDQTIEMYAHELLGHLEERYRLRSSSSDRAILGAKDFGLTAAYAALAHPDIFGKAAIQSVGLRNGAQDQLYEMIRRRPVAEVELYVDWNRYESREIDRGVDFAVDTRALATMLERNGYTFSGGEALDSHGWGGWRARTDRILEAFFPLSRR